jgi:acyl-CoA synthetase (NDP forming)/RimJ/RimL family protein N-acetyltransferase
MPADPSGDHPQHWDADVVLRDGGTAHLRPITPADAEALQRMHVAQSPESTFLRFFGPMPRLTEGLLRQFTQVDHTNQVAIVALIGGEIVGLASYDRVAEGQAEVAFNISDAHQGRGLGSVLLEHLAAAARDRGIFRFVAEVLPQNRKMVAVFREAGYEVTNRFDHGVIALAFDIDPTDRSLAVMEAREHGSEAASLRALLTPQSIVVIGASRDPESIGSQVLRHVIEAGFTGSVLAVNPAAVLAGELQGVRCYADISQVPGPVDVALVVVPSGAVLDVVQHCRQAGVRGLIVMSEGFAEVGAQGLARQRELVRVARADGMRLLGPSSMGLLNTDPRVRLNASLAQALPAVGGLGLFSQSGALGVAALASAARRGLGVSSFVSAGNRADVSGNDCLQYWEEDPGTAVVGLYLESMGNARKFSRIARRLSHKKPVIVVKSGVSGYGVPPGHVVRSSLAPREALDSLLRQAGVLRVENMHQLFDVAQLLLHQPLPAGPRIGIVGNSQAMSVLVADAVISQGLEVGAAPVTVRSEPSIEEFREALGRCYAQDGIDAVVACFIPPLGTISPAMLRTLSEVSAASAKTTVACLLGVRGVTGVGADRGAALTRDGASRSIPAYPAPEDAVLALASVVRYAQWRGRQKGVRVDPSGVDRAAARELVERLLSGIDQDARVQMGVDDVRGLLACYGLTLWPTATVTGEQDAVRAAERLGWPVVLKSTAYQRRHRRELGGVVLDIPGAKDLRGHVQAMRRRIQEGTSFVVQPMAPEGASCVLRTMEDGLLGPIISFGLAGDASDLLGDVAHRIPPMTTADVGDLVRSVRAAPRLTGYRGAPPLDVRALEDVVARLSCLADDLPQVAELELNPVIVAEHGVALAGATAVLSHPAGRADGARRSLLS